MNTNNSNKQIFSLPEEELTDCEVLVMRVIWNSAEIMSIQEITSSILCCVRARKTEKSWWRP